jgi:hypothetical protein
MRMTRRLLPWISFAAMWLAGAAPARAAIFYVGTAGDPACDFTEIQAAVNHAASVPGPDVIRLVYTRSYAGQAVTIQDRGDLNIVGGFDNCSDGTASGGLAVLDGTGGSPPLVSVFGPGTVKLRFLALQNNPTQPGLNVICPGCTVELLDTHIRYNGGGLQGQPGAGGVFAAAGALLRIRANVSISYNRGVDCGGVRLTLGAVLDMSNAPGSRISDNVAEIDGGGLCVYDSVAWIGAEVSRNTAGRDGGGIAVIGDSALLMYPTHPTFPPRVQDNVAGGRGGGIFAGTWDYYYTPVQHAFVGGWDAVIERNRARYGGGLYAANELDGDSRVAVCLRSMRAMPQLDGYCGAGAPGGAVACAQPGQCNRVADNVAAFPGGVPLSLGAALQSAGPRTLIHISHAVLTGNRGWSLVGHGAGIVPSSDANVIIDDSLLADNALDFAAVFNQQVHTTKIRRSTIAGNTARPIRLDDYTLFYLTDAIVWEPGWPSLSRAGSTGVDFTYMVLASEVASLTATSNVLLTSNPGFTDAASGNYHLRPDSPAVDFSSTTAGFLDLDGQSRGVDLPAVPNRFGPRDLGAYERQNPDEPRRDPTLH